MLEIKNVSKYYNSSGVVTLGLRNINLNFNYGEIVAITGESGSGKSTLLNVICGVDSYDEGEILFEGNETSYFNQDDMDAFRRKNVAFIYQEYNIIDSYTVLDNIMAPLLLTGMKWKQARQRAIDLAEKVGLKGRLKNKGSNLSGGEKQRCVIARALASDAPILACDEPTGNLDSKTGEEIISLIKKVSAGKLVLIVTHNYQQVEGIITRTIKLHDGEVIEDSGREIKASEEKVPMTFEKEGKLGLANQTMLALSGIKSAPKKTLLVLSIFSIFSIFAVISLCIALLLNSSYFTQKKSPLPNTLPNRVIIYGGDGNKIELDELDEIMRENECYINGFYEDYLFSSMNYSNKASLSLHLPKGINNVIGDRDLSPGKCFVVFSSLQEQLFEKNHIYPNSYFRIGDAGLRVAGTGYSDGLSNTLVVIHNDNFSSTILQNVFAKETTLYLENGSSRNIKNINFYVEDTSQTSLYLPSSVLSSKEDISIKIDSYYSFSFSKDDYNLINISDNEEKRLLISSQLLERVFSENCYELVAYSDNMPSLINKVKTIGLNYIIPQELLSNEPETGFNLFLRDFSILAVVVVILLLSFVAYVTMRGLYKTKEKEYAIMRAIGYNRK
ncbi:MAG: ABC transporter ATP-binding protein, partial [Clostridia bacterium]|nr:ABC transporter ATP-binding protein [Clostridia bacterium]